MDMSELEKLSAGQNLPYLRRTARRILFELLRPYFSAIMDELNSIRREIRVLGELDTSDLFAIKNRLANIEDSLIQRLPAEHVRSSAKVQ